MSWWWCERYIGSTAMYWSVSCIQPMFHFMPKPRPPALVGFETPGHEVDSSAIMMTPGCLR